MSNVERESVPTHSHTYECQVCRWKKNTKTQSNVPSLDEKKAYTICPQCGNKEINSYKRKPRFERWLEGV